MTIRAIIRTQPAEQFIVARTALARLKKAFDGAGIEIPFPQRTITIRSDDRDHPLARS